MTGNANDYVDRLSTELSKAREEISEALQQIANHKQRLTEYENEIRDLRLALQRCRESKDRLYATIEKLEDERR